jgi:alpha 1,6-mannosyltransferase
LLTRRDGSVQHSDMLRYFLLLLHGGIYTDLDTKLLKPIPTWGEDYDLYRQGRGWLYPSNREEVLTQGEVERWKKELGGASLIVGVESDVGDREDWNDWWPRPVSFRRFCE